MGLTTIDGKRLTQMNDNVPRPKGGLDELPITAEDWRSPPVIATEPGVRWYCLVTAPQGEYRCADALSGAGVASYVPTDTRWVVRIKAREKRREQIQSPIFRGYLFARIASPADWEPVYARDAFQRSRAGVIGVIGAHGAPVPMPLRSREFRDGNWVRCGIADFADEEREGWFDDRRRPNLIAGRDAAPAPAVMAGEAVQIVGGAFAGRQGVAENDNAKGEVRIWADVFGGRTLMTISLDDIENLSRKTEAALRRA